MPIYLRRLLSALITFYQHTLSPDHGLFKAFFPHGTCRFYPSCSEFTKQSINQHDWRGLLLGLKQLSHCHPYSKS